MGYAQRLISRILNDEKARRGADAPEKVYSDEPILRTGADLLRQRERQRAAAQAAPSSIEVDPVSQAHGRPRAKDGSPRRAGARSRTGRSSQSGWNAFGTPDAARSTWWEHEAARMAEQAIPPRAPECPLPPTLQKLRALERDAAARMLPENQLFVQQARLAAAYEDDYAFEGTFQHYFPTYRRMSDPQLRGYFAWRTQVRRGAVEKTSLSFAFVYLYELANGITACPDDPPERVLEQLERFCAAYGDLDPRINRYAQRWRFDFALSHGLDAQLPPRQAAREQALATLIAADAPSARTDDDEGLFDALAALSSYRIDKSALLQRDPDALREAACGAWRALAAYCRTHRKRTLVEHLFGVCSAQPYPLFPSCVYCAEGPHADEQLQIGPITRFVCKGGRWMRQGYFSGQERSAELGAMLKAVDAALRAKLGVAPQLKEADVPKYVQRIIEKQVDAVMEKRRQKQQEEEQAAKRRVVIDFSKLAAIRSEAAASCDALLTEEERNGGAPAEPPLAAASPAAADPAESEPEAANAPCEPGCNRASGSQSGPAFPAGQAASADRPADGPASADPPKPTGSPASADALAPAASSVSGNGSPGEAGPLTAAEARFVRCLLDDASPEQVAQAQQAAGASPELLMDAVNEKLFDLVGDVVLVDEGDGIQLVEDYREDVRGIVAA